MKVVLARQTRFTRRVELNVDRIGAYLTFWEGRDEMAGVSVQWPPRRSVFLRRGFSMFSRSRQDAVASFAGQPPRDDWYDSDRMLGY